MNKDQRKGKSIKPAKNKEIIPGISSYCDQWCQRCPFTSRCSTFLFNKELGVDPPDALDENRDFFEQVSNLLNVVKRMIKEKSRATESSSIVSDVSPDDYHPENLLYIPKSFKLTLDYGVSALEWMHNNSKIVEGKLHELRSISSPTEAKLYDALEVIRWYSFFINSKVKQAYVEMMMGYRDKNRNYRGTAKIAIIAMERSIESWSVMYEHIPQLEDEILGFLTQLSSLKSMALNDYPKAMSYKRPGFDK